MLLLHIAAGGAGLISGAGALAFRKGEPLHRAAGRIFFVSMLAMSGVGALLAVFLPSLMTVMAGMVTFYLVATAWAAVKQPEGPAGRVEAGAGMAATALVLLGLVLAAQEASRGEAAVTLIFTALAGWGAAMDFRTLRRGRVAGADRIGRHLWRMCAALLIAAVSFFLGQQKVLPEMVRGTPFVFLPPLAVLGSLIFWSVRVRWEAARREVRGAPTAGSSPSSA
jgi:uncharacterized membrane protein